MSDHDRDAHLMVALRHAPDRDVAPPAAVSRTILQQAQEATRAAPTYAPVPWWTRMRQAVGRWTGPGPAPAAAFGTLAVAGIVGLMWATQDTPPGVVEPATAAAPREAVASSDAPAQSAAAPLPQSTAPAAAPPTVAETRTQPSAQPAAAKSSPRVAAAPVKAPIEAARADANAQAAEPAIATAPATAPAPAPVPFRPAAPARDEPVAAVAPAAPAAAPRSAVQSSPSAQESAAFKPEAAVAADAAAPSRERRAAGAPSATAMGLARSNASPLAVIDRATAAQWLLPQGRTVAHGAPQQRWLADVQRGIAAWQRTEGPDPTASAVQLVARDGDTPLGTLWLDGTSLWWRDAAGTLWTAQARDDQVRGWLAALKGW